MTEMIEHVKDDGRVLFRVSYATHRSVTFSAIVEEVTGWTSTSQEEAAEYNPYYESFMIGWDSCAHFRFARENMHFCGVEDFKKHILLIRWLYAKAFEAMNIEPQPDEVWTE